MVINGVDGHVPHRGHTRANVYIIMLLQVVHDYAGIGDFRTLSENEIRMFYQGLKQDLLNGV